MRGRRDEQSWDEFARRSANYGGSRESMEYFEDAHRDAAAEMPQYSQTPTMQQSVMQQQMRYVPSYGNFFVYEPRTPEDVQVLIDHLKQREPALVNLNNVEPSAAQRVLDFVSGATYALNGSVHRVEPNGNIFLLSPEGVGVTVPYESK